MAHPRHKAHTNHAMGDTIHAMEAITCNQCGMADSTPISRLPLVFGDASRFGYDVIAGATASDLESGARSQIVSALCVSLNRLRGTIPSVFRG